MLILHVVCMHVCDVNVTEQASPLHTSQHGEHFKHSVEVDSEIEKMSSIYNKRQGNNAQTKQDIFWKVKAPYF